MEPKRRRRRSSVSRPQLVIAEFVELLQVEVARFVPELQECLQSRRRRASQLYSPREYRRVLRRGRRRPQIGQDVYVSV